MRYIIILHSWFVGSRSWKVKESKAKNYDEVSDEAKIMMVDSKEDMDSSDYLIVEIKNNERLNRKNKLTFKERLIGRINNDKND